MPKLNISLQCICGNDTFSKTFLYDNPPEGEVKFNFSSSGGGYKRKVYCCESCGHYLSVHEMDDSALYEGDYVESNYGKEGILEIFNRINSLSPYKSDNIGRVERIINFAKKYFDSNNLKVDRPSVLDVGSGLCVFLYRMKEASWDCTALDPDKNLVEHAKINVGVNGICTDFFNLEDTNKYDLVTFNKVLEHVKNPIRMLEKAKQNLNKEGIVYIELPDGEKAVKDGKGREEFFIEHHHVFSLKSLTILAEKSGFKVLKADRLIEPSTKYTLFAFLKPNN